MKKLLLGALALALLGGVYFYWQLGALVKAAIETYGPKLTQTTVQVRGVSLSPLSGRGRIAGLRIGSPAGFQEPYVFSLEDVRVSLDPKSLASDKIVVHEIALVGPDIRYETGPAGSNFTRLERNVESFLPPSSGKAASKPIKVRIERFAVRNGRVTAAVFGVKAALPLPDITVTGIGSRDGASIKDAVSQMLAAVTSGALKAVAGAGKGLQGGVKAASGRLSRAFQGLFKK